ncbi:MAG: polysaccharide export protein [Deltaproteobacteria bacterium]|nr:polysaccharide export protein [Deltaproteobacteria bacterium]
MKGFRKTLRAAAAAAVIVVVPACFLFGRDRSGAEPPHFTPDPANKGVGTTLGVGDVFEVKVFGETELSGVYRVSSDGVINFPLVGKVKAEGRSPTELSDDLTAKLKDGFLKNPQVSIFVKDYNSKKVFVFGEVNKPGTFAYDDDMTIIQAITIAGGFLKTAAKNKVSVTRIEDGVEKRVFLSVEDIGRGKEKNFFMKPGDIVFVPESLF